MEAVRIGVGGLVQDSRGRVLLVKHNYPSYWKDRWILPGGMLNPGETLQQAARREIWEETSLEVEIGPHLITFDRIVSSAGRVLLHVVYIDFWATVTAGTLRPGDDVGEARWAHPQELPALKHDIHEDARTILRAAGFVL
ncbi:MAG: NUDIX domain-containing protein [Syntrophomonadaceae bacterium]|nr:NUDIX domain-containing protein [Syntrophomonadaceae bacterium]